MCARPPPSAAFRIAAHSEVERRAPVIWKYINVRRFFVYLGHTIEAGAL
jgi:hypothetical protein